MHTTQQASISGGPAKGLDPAKAKEVLAKAQVKL
jgi:hypothetical protein